MATPCMAFASCRPSICVLCLLYLTNFNTINITTYPRPLCSAAQLLAYPPERDALTPFIILFQKLIRRRPFLVRTLIGSFVSTRL